MKNYMASTIHLLISTYMVLIFIRIVISWFPSWHHFKAIRFVAFCTDPFLNFFRRILPPLGGVLDLSPLLAYFGLKLLDVILQGLLR